MVCFECKEFVDKKEAIKFDSHYYHSECYAKLIARKQLFQCVCKIFGLVSPGPKIIKQRKDLLGKGLDDVGIVRALKYIYNIKKIPVPTNKYDDNVGLGLVPFYYHEAEEYWEKQEQQQQRIAMTMADALQKEKNTTEVITINRSNNRRQAQLLSICEPEEEN